MHDFPAQLARTRRFTLGVPHDFTLSPVGRHVLYLRTRGGEDPTTCLWRHDGERETLIAAPEGGVTAYSADAALRTVVYLHGGDLWAVPATGGTPRRVPTPGPATAPRLDPTGARVAYVTGRALHITDLGSGSGPGQVRTLATPEHADITWGLPEHVAAESMHRTRGHWWSPDGTRLLAARTDTSPVQRWWIADPADPARPPRAIPYPAAGTANAQVTLHVLHLDGTRVPLDCGPYEYVTAAGWDACGPLVTVQSRDQRTLRVLAADPATGATTLLHEQTDPAWVELVPGTPARADSGALVHVTDTPTTRRLLYDGRPVTPEGLQIRAVLDTSGDTVLFTAGDDPTQTHLWSYAPAIGLTRHSTEPGRHTGHLAGDTLLLASSTARGNAFHLLHLVHLAPHGRPIAAIPSLDAEPVVTPDPVRLRAGEHGIHTLLLLPSHHRPGTPLPVLLCPYAGPALQLVTHGRHWALNEAQWFAEQGYAVVVADGRGTPGRGPAWEKTVHLDTLTAPLEDQVTALRAAAAHCPDLDLGRVAIRGWSYGGTLAAAAVLRRPDVFHAAIAGAAPSDQRLYDTHWRERFLGHPDDDPGAYDRSSLLADAPRLRRPLLLIHGLADDNVAPAHTLRLSAALLAAGRPHQVLPLPGEGHRPSDEATVAGLLRFQLAFLRDALRRDAFTK